MDRTIFSGFYISVEASTDSSFVTHSHATHGRGWGGVSILAVAVIRVVNINAQHLFTIPPLYFQKLPSEASLATQRHFQRIEILLFLIN